MQQENLSAANIDAASSWTQTRDDFINIVIFNYVRNNLNTKKHVSIASKMDQLLLFF